MASSALGIKKKKILMQLSLKKKMKAPFPKSSNLEVSKYFP